MPRQRGVAGALTIAVCGVILVLSGYFAVVYFEHTQVALPLILVAVVCAAIIVATITAMWKGPR
jgi:hypothetical protein